MRRLRVECSWKAGQTHRSLARYLLEETHETLEAIDTGDAEHLREELGDLLLQVYFHAVIAEEAGEFTLDDVAADIIAKMRRRNPHVFGDGRAARRRRDQRGCGRRSRPPRSSATVGHRRAAARPARAAVRRQGARPAGPRGPPGRRARARPRRPAAGAGRRGARGRRRPRAGAPGRRTPIYLEENSAWPTTSARPATEGHQSSVTRTSRVPRFVECDLTGVLIRGSEVARMDIDAPWLVPRRLLCGVNGVDVDGRYVEGELRPAASPVAR